jgi:uncharacterized protein YcbK (DUF882 family)
MKRSIGLCLGAALAAVFLSGGTASAKDADAGTNDVYRLHMFHTHTGEKLDVVYRIGDRYLPEAIDKLNHFLRDHRTQAESRYDPREFDLLHAIMEKLGRPNGEIDIVCGYRTPWSNNFLRSRSADSGVAKNSQHVQAKAIDIRVPGVSTAKLRDAALSLHAGGVGYYPVNQFVHVDVGPVREWRYGTTRKSKMRSVARSTRHRVRPRATTVVSGE